MVRRILLRLLISLARTWYAKQRVFGLRFDERKLYKAAAAALKLEDSRHQGKFQLCHCEKSSDAGILATFGDWWQDPTLRVVYSDDSRTEVLARKAPPENKVRVTTTVGMKIKVHVKAMDAAARRLAKQAKDFDDADDDASDEEGWATTDEEEGDREMPDTADARVDRVTRRLEAAFVSAAAAQTAKDKQTSDDAKALQSATQKRRTPDAYEAKVLRR